jgi:hypothetical protein
MPYGYWNSKESVINDALQYNVQAEWKDASPGAYQSAKKRGWLDEACSHMTGGHKPSGYWDEARLKADALKYGSPTEWKKRSGSAYATAVSHGLLAQCCSHMNRVRQAPDYWTKERVLESASRFQVLKEWSLADGAAYDVAKRRKWIREATRHMVKTFSLGEYTIYRFLQQHDIAFEHQKRFPDLKHMRRLPYDFYLPRFELVIEYHGRQHFESSKSSRFKAEIANIKKRDRIKEDYALARGLNYLAISEEAPSAIEEVLVERLKGLGGCDALSTRRELMSGEEEVLASLGVWTRDSVIEYAKRFQRPSDWHKAPNASYQIAQKKGWLAEATAHMARTQKPFGYWSKERVAADALKYATRMEWFRGNRSAYQSAVSKGWLAEVTAHMPKDVRWKKEKL